MVGPFQGFEGSGGVSAEGDNVTHRIEGGVYKVRHQVLFLCDPDEESGRQKERDWLKEHHLDEVNVAGHEHERKSRVRRSSEIREAQDSDNITGVDTVRLGTGYQTEEEVIVFGFIDSKEGGNWRSAIGRLVQFPCDGSCIACC